MLELLKVLLMGDLVELLRLLLHQTRLTSIIVFIGSGRHRTVVRIARRRRIEGAGEVVSVLIVRNETILLLHLQIDHLGGVV